MRKRLVLALVILSVGKILLSQEKKRVHQFHSINTVTLINGSNAVSAGLQSVNGFKKGSWFAGAGIGIDYYLYRTVPVFADLRYEFGKKKNKFFVYADAGANLSWVQNQFIDNPSIWNGNTGNKYRSGIYNDVGLGYYIKMKKESALVLSLGYSHKNLKETETFTDWRTQELMKREYNYDLRRIMIKTGWRF